MCDCVVQVAWEGDESMKAGLPTPCQSCHSKQFAFLVQNLMAHQVLDCKGVRVACVHEPRALL